VTASSVVLLDRANHFTDAYFSVLADRRFEVRRVTSLDDALSLLTGRRSVEPDMLLLNGSGRPTPAVMGDLARLRDADPDLPVVVLTLASDPVLSGRVRALGAAGVLAAPWLPRDLVVAHERAVELRRRRREAAPARAAASAVAVRAEVDTRRTLDLEQANARLAAEVAEARTAATRIETELKIVKARKTALDARQAQLRGVAELSASLVGTRDAATVVELVVREAARLLAADAGALRLVDEAGAALRPAFVLGGLTGGGLVRFGEGVQGWVARTGRPLGVSDTAHDVRVRPADRMGQPRERLACVPITLRGRLLGTLLLARLGSKAPFSGGDLELLGTLAAQAAVAIGHAREAESLEASYLAGLRDIVRGAERAEPARADHADNVAFFGVRLARAAGLEDAQVTVVRRAAWLHDLGHAFMGPLRPGARFTAEERRAVLDHPVLGYRVVEPVAFLGEARAVVRDHQERFDGSGYPDGRDGESLAVETRIVSIADAFDAMTRDRGYRAALSVEAAATELRGHAGSQFDPELVERFVELLHRDQGDDTAYANGSTSSVAAGLVVQAAGSGFAA
jgi:HD-GYP domain-containing protein (c-di-GMP phosphodiesterase class II)